MFVILAISPLSLSKITKNPSLDIVKINLSISTGLIVELIFFCQLIAPVKISNEKNSFLLFENNIDLLSVTKSEVFKRNAFS